MFIGWRLARKPNIHGHLQAFSPEKCRGYWAFIVKIFVVSRLPQVVTPDDDIRSLATHRGTLFATLIAFLTELVPPMQTRFAPAIKSVALAFAFLVTQTLTAHAQQCPVPPTIDPNASTVAPINTADRAVVLQAYQAIYVPTRNTAAGWNGNSATCTAGDTTAAYKTAMTRMVNYYRAMSGLPGNVALNATFSAKAQQAALMMRANNSLSHTPPTNWLCYTADGAEAASRSNLAIGGGGLGIQAASLYMDDNGVPSLGHRRWILYPPQSQYGTGDTANTNAMWLLGPWGTRPATPNGVAWPPAGFVPYPLVSASSTWSFSMPNASFAGATVQVRNASNQLVPINVSQPGDGYGDPAIAFAPVSGNWNYSSPGDSVFDISINNVNVSGTLRNFSYRVTLITP